MCYVGSSAGKYSPAAATPHMTAVGYKPLQSYTHNLSENLWVVFESALVGCNMLVVFIPVKCYVGA